ncbi:MAG: ATP-binding cassette domain-containing protein [Rhodospirillum sp.]|nr:ATP-binding cassette domain-containing protein [Rhodospirillum sp.]MCF8491250.1 ATP-binding cassette domain-containing protein [Rhodospirillum sp.]MCF8500774.1 ATP-binding cassette domain-containing protein [Rhodospirillum sp.]
MPRLDLEGVTTPFLGPLDLSVADGEAVALLGPSGSGKTTLLKAVAGLIPHGGRIRFDGRPMERTPPHHRDIGYLSQDVLAFPHLSVAASLRLVLFFDQASAGRRAERVRRTLELCAITHRADRRPDQLSGGERQRAALARALARRPSLLLLDEPFSSLDPETRRQLWAEVGGLRRTLGMTALVVTHDPEEARVLADRVIYLRDGKLVQADKGGASTGARSPAR